MFFNLSINDFFYISNVQLHNFADYTPILAFAETILESIDILQSESKTLIYWFKDDKMIVNPDKFQAILLDKIKSDHTNQCIIVDNQNTKVVSSVQLLRIQTGDELNFNFHISHICRSATNQLNVFIRLKRFHGFKEKKILIGSDFMTKFNYCLLVWMFLSALSLNKIENLQRRTLSLL